MFTADPTLISYHALVGFASGAIGMYAAATFAAPATKERRDVFAEGRRKLRELVDALRKPSTLPSPA